MPTRSRLRLFLLLPPLLLTFAAVWGVHTYLADQVSTNTQALIKAVEANDAAAVVFLLDHGADPNVRDSSGTTMLGNAVLLSRTPLVSDLLAHGADVNRRTNGETVLFWAATRSNDSIPLVRLLIAHGADVDIQEDGFHQTVLMRVTDNSPDSNQVVVVQAILLAHPRLDLKDMSGDTAWRIASKAGNKEIAALLKKAGAVEYSILPPIVVHHAAYSITDLGPGQANALNNHGDVVGQASNGIKDSGGNLLGQAFVWHQGRLRILKPFRGPFSSAVGINDRGQVVGGGAWAIFGPSYCKEWTQHAFLWENGIMHDLHPHSGWSTKNNQFPSSGIAINHLGLVALSVNADAFLWQSGQWHDLKTHGEKSGMDTAVPIAMNDNGQIVYYLQASGWERAGFGDKRGWKVLASPDNGPITIEGHTYHPSLNNYAYGINDNGAAVGDDDDREALLWTHGKPKALPGLYHHGEMNDQMRAEHINNRGLIVGTVSDDLYVRNPEQHAVLWSGGRVTDLNALIPASAGWVLEDARAINEQGQIVGRGTFRGKEHAFLLTPLAGSERVY